jgi:hypothetical protein
VPDIRERLKRNAFRVRHVDKPFLGYFSGMNAYAAKSLKIPYPYKTNTVVVAKGLSKQEERRTIEHEKREATLMRKGQSYRQAHANTLLIMGDKKEKDAAFKDSDRNIEKAREQLQHERMKFIER